ncbi:MAG TPA: hypothetical protein DDY32_00865, partial [Desulfobulbaceae bacterium]|nr:hypothetical protein [Desulfobulbaceae bacterium]
MDQFRDKNKERLTEKIPKQRALQERLFLIIKQYIRIWNILLENLMRSMLRGRVQTRSQKSEVRRQRAEGRG